MLAKVKGLLKDEQGQGMTEYGLVLGLIAVAVVGILAAFRGEIILMFEEALATLKSRNPDTTTTTTT
jgi:pilus assembly protein Flp/PilA